MGEFANRLHNHQHVGYSGKIITDIVNIGIGGSDLGPHLVCEALKPYRKNKLNVHFISSVDGYQMLDILNDLNPETTLFIIASKTFTTQETMTNATSVRAWFLAHTNNNHAAIKKHFVACSTNATAVANFGIDPVNMFEFWDFVGGRYSLWSAIGLPIMLYIGEENFLALLAGAKAMDQHFQYTTDLTQNMPVIMALISIWYINFYHYPTQVILPYNTRLSKLPDYLQQQQMESNGKSIGMNGDTLSYQTCPVIWGGSGINGQHAYFQLLHQGTQIHPLDIIVTTSSKNSDEKHNAILVANAIAQAEAFMCGKTTAMAKNELLVQGVDVTAAEILARHKTFNGNRPSNMLFLKELSPYYLGQLIALYEHKTFVQGIIWGINSFDQWGVELGKELAKTILANIDAGTVTAHDKSTTGLIKEYLKVRK
jgi:glucose-6-phosphate isomerase